MDQVHSTISNYRTWNLSEYNSPINLTAIQEASIWATFIFLTIFGCLVNAFMIVILMRMKANFFSVILIGLCVSDLISALHSPIFVYGQLYIDDYRIAWIFCYMWLSIESATSSVTSQHVLMLSLIRLRSIIKFGGSTKETSVKKCRIYIVTSYAITFLVNSGLATITMEYKTIGEVYYCGIREDFGAPYIIASISSQIVGMLIPSVLILVCCIVLIVFLLHRRSSGISSSSSARQRENQALIQLTAIVTCFIFGYLVDFAVKIYAVLNKFTLPRLVLVYLGLATHCILRVCECLNPFLYYLGSSDIKIECGRLIANIRNRTSACIQAVIQSNREAPTGHELQQIEARQPSCCQPKHTNVGHRGNDAATAVTSIVVESPSNISDNVVSKIVLFSDEVMPTTSTTQSNFEVDIPLPGVLVQNDSASGIHRHSC